MATKSKSLEVQLFDAGYSEEFVDYAMNHQNSYDGDLKKFIDLVEHFMDSDLDNQSHADSETKGLMDRGSRRVEHDYTGDNLTSGGYDHTNQNRRW